MAARLGRGVDPAMQEMKNLGPRDKSGKTKPGRSEQEGGNAPDRADHRGLRLARQRDGELAALAAATIRDAARRDRRRTCSRESARSALAGNGQAGLSAACLRAARRGDPGRAGGGEW